MSSLPLSRFEGIALELREKIYQQLFTGLQLSLELRLHPKRCSDCGFVHDVLYTAMAVLPEADYHSQRNLLKVNSQIRAEALPRFKASTQDLYISGDVPRQYHSLKLIPTCEAYCFIPPTVLRSNNIKSLVLGELSEQTFEMRKTVPEVWNVMLPNLSCFSRLESITVTGCESDIAGVMHGAAKGANLEQLRLGHLCNNRRFLAQVSFVFQRKLVVGRLNPIFESLQRQSRNGVRVNIRHEVFIRNKDLGHEEQHKLIHKGLYPGEYIKVDVELRRAVVGDFESVHARFIRGWSPRGIEGDSGGDQLDTTEVNEASDVWGRKTQPHNYCELGSACDRDQGDW